MEQMESYHFHDVEKNANINRDMNAYTDHLKKVFGLELVEEISL
jgi:modulator of drug activity B